MSNMSNEGVLTDRTMEELIERYKTASGEAQQGDGCGDQRMVKLLSLPVLLVTETRTV